MRTKPLLFIPLLIFLFSTSAIAQQKIRDNTIGGVVLPDKDALLELESTNKGLLHARVQLSGVRDAAPLSQHRAGMMVYNTATVNDVVPGIYYNNGARWILVEGGDVTALTYNPVTYELTYLDEHGETQVINLEEVVKAQETPTTLAYGAAAHALTYTGEDGMPRTLTLDVGTISYDASTKPQQPCSCRYHQSGLPHFKLAERWAACSCPPSQRSLRICRRQR
ncbi:hypothetical protein [Parapedobacter soli]|uniref:hypothetical protein n=1 Tax=Parapedobacter soli TaxID=416955 RepID=UPI0021C6795B|nr:hypothetical protein [Parapedobacter soli]